MDSKENLSGYLQTDSKQKKYAGNGFRERNFPQRRSGRNHTGTVLPGNVPETVQEETSKKNLKLCLLGLRILLKTFTIVMDYIKGMKKYRGNYDRYKRIFR